MVEELQAQCPQLISSMTKVEGAMGRTTMEVEELPEVQKEPESSSGKSAT
jgi:hypothetical protein